MPTVKEKIAYLKGLMEGSEFYGNDTHAQTVWGRMMEILDDLAEQVEVLRASQEEAEEYLEAIDSDLSDVEDEVYDTGDAHDEEIEFIEMECPECQETVYFEEDFLYDDDVEISCPECGRVLFSSDAEEEEGAATSVAEGEQPANGTTDVVRGSSFTPERSS